MNATAKNEQMMKVVGNRWKGFLFVLMLCLCFINNKAHAAATYNSDAAIYNGAPGSGTFGGAFNASLGANNILFAVVSTDSPGSLLTFAVTYGGTSMTLLRTDCVGNVCQYIYYLVNPAASGTLAANPTPDDWNTTRMMAFTYSGVNQSTPIGAHNGVAGSPGASPWSLSVDVTPTNSTSTLVQISNLRNGGCPPTSFATSSGTTRYTNFTNVNNAHGEALSDWSPGFSGTPASFNHQYTCTTGGLAQLIVAGVELLPSGPPPVPTPTVTPTPNFTLVKSSNVATANVGDTITFCIAWNNPSSSPMTRTFYDNLESEYTYIGSSSGCSAAGQLVTCSFAAAAGSSGSKCIWVQVNSVP